MIQARTRCLLRIPCTTSIYESSCSIYGRHLVHPRQDRFFSSATRNNQSGWKRSLDQANRLLKQVESETIPVGLVAIHAKEVLIQLVNCPKHADKGKLASRLLDAARQDLLGTVKNQQSAKELRSKLHQLVSSRVCSLSRARRSLSN